MASSSALFSITSSPNSIACATFLAYSFLSLSSRICKSSRSIAFGIVLKIYLIIQIKLSFLKLLLIIILVEFRDYVAILGGLIRWKKELIQWKIELTN
jgi:hypothetical protein